MRELEQFKNEIIDLYQVQRLSLIDVAIALAKRYDIAPSSSTIARFLNQYGISTSKKTREILVTDKQKESRKKSFICNIRRNCRGCSEPFNADMVKKYYCANCRSSRATYWRVKLYGLKPGDFESMLNAQKNACKLCKTSFKNASCACVDHDHASGRVRGLLCKQCNFALGLIEKSGDVASWFENARSYLA